MEWKDWIGKVVFIKLVDDRVFSYSKVLTFDNPFLSITDSYNLPVVININNISIIREENDDRKKEQIINR